MPEAFDSLQHLPLISFCVGDAPILGCTDETACNYNAAATEDDGSCATLIMNFTTSGDFFTRETGYNVVNNDTGEIVAACQQDFTVTVLPSLKFACVRTMHATTLWYFDWGDGFTSGEWTLDYNGLALSQVGATGGLQIPLTVSALDLVATMLERRTISPTATSDDGSCEYLGCTDAAACNYNESATNDDGSCAYESLSIVITPDNWPGETSWSLVNDALEVVASGDVKVQIYVCLKRVIRSPFSIHGVTAFAVHSVMAATLLLMIEGQTLAAGGDFRYF